MHARAHQHPEAHAAPTRLDPRHLRARPVAVVANASTLFAALVISPFAALSIAGLPTLDPTSWTHPPGRQIRWGTFFSVMLWNTSGYDSVGALAAEVQHPGRDFPRAMIATIILITIVYIVPLSVCQLVRSHLPGQRGPGQRGRQDRPPPLRHP
jgi:hypothetical protein